MAILLQVIMKRERKRRLWKRHESTAPGECGPGPHMGVQTSFGQTHTARPALDGGGHVRT